MAKAVPELCVLFTVMGAQLSAKVGAVQVATAVAVVVERLILAGHPVTVGAVISPGQGLTVFTNTVKVQVFVFPAASVAV